jgi:hypothetical protein
LNLGHESSLELQSAGARGIRERLDAAVIPIAGAVESHFFDAFLLRLRGNAAADQLGRLAVAAVLQLCAQISRILCRVWSARRRREMFLWRMAATSSSSL